MVQMPTVTLVVNIYHSNPLESDASSWKFPTEFHLDEPLLVSGSSKTGKPNIVITATKPSIVGIVMKKKGI